MCRARARRARKAARVMGVVLVGLTGAALISDPALVGAARDGVTSAQVALRGAFRPAADATGRFDMPVAVITGPLDDPPTADADMVTRGQADLLGSLADRSSR